MWVYYNYEHFFCFGESNDSHETTWGPLLRSSDEEILSTLNHEKDRYQEAIFLGRHRTFQIGTSYVCIELPQKNMNGSKGILYLEQSTLWFIACKDGDEVLAFYWALGDDKYFVGRKTD